VDEELDPQLKSLEHDLENAGIKPETEEFEKEVKEMNELGNHRDELDREIRNDIPKAIADNFRKAFNLDPKELLGTDKYRLLMREAFGLSDEMIEKVVFY
jgi:hypothetical protein